MASTTKKDSEISATVEEGKQSVTSPDLIHMKVTNAKPMRFYIRSAMSFLKGAGEDKPPTEKLTISALGNAINVAIACAARVESVKLGTIEAVKTDYVSVTGGGIKACPQIAIEMKRHPEADNVTEDDLKLDKK